MFLACSSDPLILAVTPAPRFGPEAEAYLAAHERHVARMQTEDIDVLLLGDSIVQNWHDAGAETLESMLAPSGIAAHGIGGDRTENLLWRVQNGEIDGVPGPRIIVLLIGTNNTIHRMDPPEAIAAGVKAIIDEIGRRQPDAVVIVHGLLPTGLPKDRFRKNNDATNALFGKMNDGDRTRFLDLGSVFLEADETVSSEIMPDGLHLSPTGYARWATALLPELRGSTAFEP